MLRNSLNDIHYKLQDKVSITQGLMMLVSIASKAQMLLDALKDDYLKDFIDIRAQKLKKACDQYQSLFTKEGE